MVQLGADCLDVYRWGSLAGASAGSQGGERHSDEQSRFN